MSVARFKITLSIAILVAYAVTTHAGWAEPVLFTNQIAITNGQKIFSSVLIGDSQSKSNIQALVGSPVVFYGGQGPKGTNCLLTLQSNVVLMVEFDPPYVFPQRPAGQGPASHEYPSSFAYSCEVMGTFKDADCKNRIITITAKQNDLRVRELW